MTQAAQIAQASEGKRSFVFSEENLEKAKNILAKYPKDRGQSALLPLLDLAQRQNNNWIPREAMQYIAEFLKIPEIRVYEVATFYTMYNLKPVGKNFIQLCTTTPCWLRGSDEVVAACKSKLDIDMGETTEDGQFSLLEVECLGACVNAPMVQINDDYYEDLDGASMGQIIDDLKVGKELRVGSQTGRQCSAPAKDDEEK